VSVASTGNELQPAGITGPPDVMVGRATVVGDVSGGTAQISFNLPAGFLWMPRWTTVNTASAQASIIRMNNTDDVVAGATFTFAEAFTTVLFGGQAVSTIELPAFLIKTVIQAATLELFLTNVDGETSEMYVRALRWDKNSPPEAWLAFLTSPT